MQIDDQRAEPAAAHGLVGGFQRLARIPDPDKRDARRIKPQFDEPRRVDEPELGLDHRLAHPQNGPALRCDHRRKCGKTAGCRRIRARCGKHLMQRACRQPAGQGGMMHLRRMCRRMAAGSGTRPRHLLAQPCERGLCRRRSTGGRKELLRCGHAAAHL